VRARSAFRSLAVLPVAIAAVALFACGGGNGTDAAANAPSAASKDDGGAAGAVPDAAVERHPFAGSAAEATQLIGIAVEKKGDAVMKCVADYRTRKNMPHERVTIVMGIDQEGRLLGATLPKGKDDKPLVECVQRALEGAAFPRSHAGVISITKSYEEIVQ
jgi:hypothetical protein